jgi:streptogramin lyase
MAATQDGTLRIWLADRAFVRPPGGAWTAAPASPRPPAEVTHRGELWRPSRGRGLERRRLRPRFQPYPIPAASRVHALAAAADGTIWCGTENGLARVDGEVVRSIPEVAGAALGDVTACAVDREGRVWVGSGSSFRGVWRLDRDGWRHLPEIDAFVHRITEDTTGTLWFATLSGDGTGGAGAWQFSGGQLRRAPALGELASARVYDVVARDPSGLLWFATLEGLAVFEGGSRLRRYTPGADGLRGEKVWCLCAARDGSLWIGYQSEHGASRLAQGRFTHFDVADGLCDGNVWAIEEGRPGVFWFATRNGLGRYDGRRWSAFRNEEGLGGEPIWPLLPREDGSLWIGTLGAGLVRLAPDDRAPPKTRFEAPRHDVEEGGEVTVRWSGCDAWFDTPSADLWYRWRLDGGAWSKASASTSVALAPAPGVHRLEVQAIDRFGNAEDPPPSIEILVRGEPGFPWLLLALALLGFALGRVTWERSRRKALRENGLR